MANGYQKNTERLSTKPPIDSLDILPVPSQVRSNAGKKAKRKGSQQERRLAKALSGWWGSTFRRTPMSGGSVLKEDYDLAGDVSTADKSFRFHVESKKQECFGKFHNLFFKKTHPFWKWWEQCSHDCPEDRIPLLIFTRNYCPDFVAFERKFLDCIEDDPSSERFIGSLSNGIHFVENLVIISMEDLFSLGKNRISNASEKYFKT